MNSRRAIPSDIEKIAELLIPFCEEYHQKVVTQETAIKGIRHLFENPHLGRYYICEEEGRVIGYLMVFFEWSDWRAGNMYYIEAVYTIPDFRNRGVSKSLYKNMYDDAITENSVLRTIVPITFSTEALKKIGLQESHYNLLEIKF